MRNIFYIPKFKNHSHKVGQKILLTNDGGYIWFHLRTIQVFSKGSCKAKKTNRRFSKGFDEAMIVMDNRQ